jgi:hypothetical protein
MKRTSRKPSALSESAQRHLNAYALAASAAGVGVLALALPAEAKIVYTKADVVIDFNSYLLDLNHDGVNDFDLKWYLGSGSNCCSIFGVSALRSNAIWGAKFYGQGRHWAAPLPANEHVHVGPRRHFDGHVAMASWDCSLSTCHSNGP